MARDGKWIDHVDRDVPVSVGARRVLSARLRSVWRQLPLAALDSHRDIEHIHQLRVATRRAMAALEIYEPLLPARRGAWMVKQLKRARRAAGDARDLDVLVKRLKETVSTRRDDAYQSLLERVRQLRREAQIPVVELQRKLLRGHFRRKANKLVRKTRWRDPLYAEPSFEDASRLSLAQALEPIWIASDAEPTDVAALHRLRIQLKRLRYSMEIFAGGFEPAFRRELYPVIESAQELLGAVNDHAAAAARFQTWRSQWNNAHLDGPLDELLAAERAALAEARSVYLAYWTSERRADLVQRFAECLAPRTDREVA